MPATAGRIRMPANNRLSVSDSLRSSEIWQKSVGYDPYAPAGVEEVDPRRRRGVTSAEAMLKAPGACSRCGEVGHLTYQCRNPVCQPASNPPKSEPIEKNTIRGDGETATRDGETVRRDRESARRDRETTRRDRVVTGENREPIIRRRDDAGGERWREERERETHISYKHRGEGCEEDRDCDRETRHRHTRRRDERGERREGHRCDRDERYIEDEDSNRGVRRRDHFDRGTMMQKHRRESDTDGYGREKKSHTVGSERHTIERPTTERQTTERQGTRRDRDGKKCVSRRRRRFDWSTTDESDVERHHKRRRN